MRFTSKLPAGLLSLAVLGMASDTSLSTEVLPAVPAAVKGERCVEPLDVIRREHMSLLLHQRDRTVHQGERDTEHSLTDCLSCHTRKDERGTYIPVNAPGEFCYECHAYTGVEMDCFECHAPKPSNSAAIDGRD